MHKLEQKNRTNIQNHGLTKVAFAPNKARRQWQASFRGDEWPLPPSEPRSVQNELSITTNSLNTTWQSMALNAKDVPEADENWSSYPDVMTAASARVLEKSIIAASPHLLQKTIVSKKILKFSTSHSSLAEWMQQHRTGAYRTKKPTTCQCDGSNGVKNETVSSAFRNARLLGCSLAARSNQKSNSATQEQSR